MTTNAPALLSDRELLEATARVVDCERRTTAELLPLLAEMDARQLHLSQGYSSLFAYCTQALHLSEAATYSRITAARAARRFPVILALLADGAITLTTITLLAADLTDENHEALLEAARHKSKDDVQKLVAALHPQPDIASSVRKLPSPRHREVTALRLRRPRSQRRKMRRRPRSRHLVGHSSPRSHRSDT